MTGIWYVVGFAFAGVSFVFLTIGAAWLVSHRNRGDEHKGLPYESGIDTYGDTHGRFGLSFYIYALLFVAFDIEVVFIYLWAIAFRDLLLGGLVSMLIFVADPAARPRLRLAQGGPDMAVTRRAPDARGQDGCEGRATCPPSTDQRTDVLAPIVVPNTLWQAADPEAYDGGRESDITHLREFEASGLGRRDDARWSGVLEVIPTKADYVLDLIRMNSLWPLLSGLACCAIEMMSTATSKNDMDRWGMFPFRASPRQADVLIVAGHAHDQDGRPAGPAVGADARAEVVRGDGRLHLLGRPLQAELRDGRGDRPGHAGRRLRPGLPAPARGPDLRDDEAPAAGQGAARSLAGSGDRADRPEDV